MSLKHRDDTRRRSTMDNGSNETVLPSWDNPDKQTVDKIRRRIRMLARTGRYDAAEFWMDKIASLSDYDPMLEYLGTMDLFGGEVADSGWRNLTDVLNMCEYLFMDGQFAACRNIIESRSLHKARTDFQYWLGRCYFATGEFEEALRVLGPRCPPVPNRSANHTETRANVTNADDTSEASDDDMSMSPGGDHRRSSFEDSNMEEQSYLAGIQILKGRIFDKQDNRQMACAAYQQALEIDPFSCDALDYLASRQALSAEESKRVLADVSRRTRETFESDEISLVDVVYRSRIRPDLSWEDEDPAGGKLLEKSRFAKNPDFLLTRADFYLRRRDYAGALEVTSLIMKKKPFHRSALPLHVAALVYLGKSSLLFDLSHRLVTLYPQDFMTWYSTAAYYYVCGHMDMTRRYLAKAINLDKSCGHVWLLYGHSFSKEREHDQAMAAYFHAVDVMKGSFFPYMYIAREYVRTNNHLLAERFYGEAKQLAPDDPAVLHDIGILHIKKADAMVSKGTAGPGDPKKELQFAVTNLLHALEVVKLDSKEQKTVDSGVEGILETLATAYMKLREAPEALKYATVAFHMNSKNTTVLKVIGMAKVMLGQIQGAVEAFQRALAISKDDALAKKMLTDTVDMCAGEGIGHMLPPVPGDLSVVPGISRKTRVARAPQIVGLGGDSGRLGIKRSLKKIAQQSAGTSFPSLGPGMAGSSSSRGAAFNSVLGASMAMDISVDLCGQEQSSFLGDFRGPSESETDCLTL